MPSSDTGRLNGSDSNEKWSGDPGSPASRHYLALSREMHLPYMKTQELSESSYSNGFLSMPSKTSTWPEGWPSFTPKDNDPTDTFQKDLKASIITEYGADNPNTAWMKTCNALNGVTSRLSSQGNTSVPIFQADEILANGRALESMKEAGYCIIRGVIPRPQRSSTSKT